MMFFRYLVAIFAVIIVAACADRPLPVTSAGPSPSQDLILAACADKLRAEPPLSPVGDIKIQFEVAPTVLQTVSPLQPSSIGKPHYVTSVAFDRSGACTSGFVVATNFTEGMVRVRIQYAQMVNIAPLGATFDEQLVRIDFGTSFAYRRGSTFTTKDAAGRTFTFTM